MKKSSFSTNQQIGYRLESEITHFHVPQTAVEVFQEVSFEALIELPQQLQSKTFCLIDVINPKERDEILVGTRY